MGGSAGGVGGGFTVVDGGPDDPFSVKGGGQSAGDDGQTTVRSSQDDAQDDDAGREGAGGADDQGGGDAADEDVEEIDPDEYFNERLKAELPRIQSGWDRQNQALKTQLDQQRAEMENLQRSIREGQLSQLSPEDQEKLKSQWDAEDTQKEIDRKLKATDDFFFNTYAFNILTRFAEYGVTEEELLACESVEDMDKLALERKADYYEAIASGKKPADARKTVSANNQDKNASPPPKKVPAGSSARTDLGGAGGVERQQGPLTDQSMASMASNIKGMFSKPGSFG